MYVLYDKHLNLNIIKTKIICKQTLCRVMWYSFVAFRGCFESQKSLCYIKTHIYKIRLAVGHDEAKLNRGVH